MTAPAQTERLGTRCDKARLVAGLNSQGVQAMIAPFASSRHWGAHNSRVARRRDSSGCPGASNLSASPEAKHEPVGRALWVEARNYGHQPSRPNGSVRAISCSVRAISRDQTEPGSGSKTTPALASKIHHPPCLTSFSNCPPAQPQ